MTVDMTARPGAAVERAAELLDERISSVGPAFEEAIDRVAELHLERELREAAGRAVRRGDGVISDVISDLDLPARRDRLALMGVAALAATIVLIALLVLRRRRATARRTKRAGSRRRRP